MLSKISFTFIVLVSLLSPCGAIQAESLSTATLPGATIPKRGGLYRIDYQGNTTYLFGTIHAGQPSFFPLEPVVMRALSQASALVLEVDIRDQNLMLQAIKKYGVYRAGDRLDLHLSTESVQKLERVLNIFSVKKEQLAQMKPWMVANFLIGKELQRNGYEPDQGIEHHLLSIAIKQAIAIKELETADLQLSLFDGMTAAQQEQYLNENLKEIETGRAAKKLKKLMATWGSADAAGIERIMLEELAEKTVSAEFYQRALIDKRHPEMLRKIEVLIKKEKSAFVAVGMLHLVGEKGMPALLKKRGYQVEKIY